MPTIKHVGTHVDDMHDGRPMLPYQSYEVSAEDLQHEHYQSRLRDGSLLEVTDTPTAPTFPSLPAPGTTGTDATVEITSAPTGVTASSTTTSTETPAEPSQTPADGLDDLSVTALRERAQNADLDIPKTAKKNDLIKALRQHAPNQED